MTDERLIWVTEVHNFGGFFGGDTVTLTAVPWPEGEEETLTIDDKALININDRHTVAPEMLLHLALSGERVDQATLLGARELAVLRHAIGSRPSASTLEGPRIRAYQCSRCQLWITGSPEAQPSRQSCAICRQPLREDGA